MTVRPASIFVVDDDATLLYMLSSILRTAGYTVEAFEHPHALLARLSPADRGVLVLDLKMPGLSGLELQSALHERGVSMPTIFVSGRADIPAAVAAMKQGAVDFLVKPIVANELLAVVARAVQRDTELAEKRGTERLSTENWATLSGREQEVCRLAAQGLIIKQIAANLGTSESTVQLQRARAWKKLGIDSTVELVRIVALVAQTHK